MSINGSFNTFSPSVDGLFNFDVNDILVNGSMLVSGSAVFTGNTTFTASANFANISCNNLSINPTYNIIFSSGAGSIKLSTTGTINLPTITGTDTFVCENNSTTLTNKIIDSGVFSGTTIFTDTVRSDTAITIRDGWQITWFDGTNTTYSDINQYGNDFVITNRYDSGYIIVNGVNGAFPTELTRVNWTEFGLRTGVPLRLWDNTNTYYTETSQFTTTYMIDTDYNSSTILLRTKDASGTAVDYSFAYNQFSFNTPLLQSGIGVITQTGTGTNALKGSTFSGNNTHYNGSIITQYDSTNTYFSQLSQVGANYFISNDTNGGVSVIRNKNSSGVANDIAISATDIVMDKNTYIQNSKVLVLTDGLTGYTQTNINHTGGNFYIQNLNPTGGYIYMNMYNGTTLETYLLIHYTAISLRTGVPLRVWNSTNAYYTELSQSGTTGYLTNINSGSSLILRTADTSGNVDERFLVTYNKIKTNVNIELPTTYTAPTSGFLGYKFNGTIASSLTITPNVVFSVGSITLGVGVWNVFGQTSYYVQTSGTLDTHAVSISSSNTSIDYTCCELSLHNAISVGNYMSRRINTIITSSGSTTVYLNALLQYFAPLAFLYDVTNTNLYAVRIA